MVSDDWAPYIYWHEGQPKGIDYEVANEVLKRLGIDVDWQLLPWKRCLAMVEQGAADGVLDIFGRFAQTVHGLPGRGTLGG